MGHLKRAFGPVMLVVAAAVLWGLTADTAPAATGPPTPQAQAMGDYVGQDACLECHEDKGQQLLTTKHGNSLDRRTPASNRGCETCHGPGKQHADTGDPDLMISFAEKSPSEVSDTCTTCHNRGTHAFWDGSQHPSRDVTCTNCHSVHNPQSEEFQFVKPTVVETCAQCHQDKAAKFQRAISHMPVREGHMDCASCHNPHGSINDRLLKQGTTINESCTTTCHAEKRGPFLWEHAPVAENCTTCHDPHGSVNDRLLVAKPPMLCQRCHVHTRHPPRPYDGSNTATAPQAYGRACVNCHQAIHGSNHPSGQAFLR